MARKRKKSKSKSKKRKQRAASPEAEASDSSDNEASGSETSGADLDESLAAVDLDGEVDLDAEVAAIDLDADLDGSSVEDLLAAASALADDPTDAEGTVEPDETEVLTSLDDDHDHEPFESATAEDRAGEGSVDVAEEETVTTISLDDDVDEDTDDLIAQALALSGEGTEPEGTTAAAPADEVEEAPELSLPADPPGPGPQTPVMTRDALNALRELRTAGVGPGEAELVLDLGEGGTPEDRDRLLQAALAHVEMQDAVYRVPTTTTRPRRFGAAATAVVLVAALWVAVAPPSILVPPSPATPTEADLLDGVHSMLWLHMQQVESFRVESGRLPRDISELSDPQPGVQYVRSSNRLYQLVMRAADGRAIMYDSGSPAPVFDGLAERFRLADGGS